MVYTTGMNGRRLDGIGKSYLHRVLAKDNLLLGLLLITISIERETRLIADVHTDDVRTEITVEQPFAAPVR